MGAERSGTTAPAARSTRRTSIGRSSASPTPPAFGASVCTTPGTGAPPSSPRPVSAPRRDGDPGAQPDQHHDGRLHARGVGHPARGHQSHGSPAQAPSRPRATARVDVTRGCRTPRTDHRPGRSGCSAREPPVGLEPTTFALQVPITRGQTWMPAIQPGPESALLHLLIQRRPPMLPSRCAVSEASETRSAASLRTPALAREAVMIFLRDHRSPGHATECPPPPQQAHLHSPGHLHARHVCLAPQRGTNGVRAWYVRRVRVDELIWNDWNEEHIAKHGVSPDEVEEACQTKPIRARLVRNETYALLGVTNSGRHLAVFLAPRGKNTYYVVTARDMDPRERQRFGRG